MIWTYYLLLQAEQIQKMTRFSLKMVLNRWNVIQQPTRLNTSRRPSAFRISNVFASKGQFATDSWLQEISNSIRLIVFETHHTSLFSWKSRKKRKVKTFKITNIQTTYFLTIFKNFSWSWQIFPNHEATSEDAYKNENFFVFRLKILNYFRPGNF